MFGSSRWMASLVISVRMPSTGTMNTLTRNTAATPAKAAAMPAIGCRPTREEGGGTQRDQHQVAGIGGDAREHADERR